MPATRSHALSISLLMGLSLGACDSPCTTCDDAGPTPGPDASARADGGGIDAGGERADAGGEDNDAGGRIDAGADASGPQPLTWQVETVADVGITDLVPSLALRGDARAIGWFDSNVRRGQVAHRGASGWTTVVVEDTQFAGYAMNVGFDSAGRTRVLYHRLTGNDLVYGTRDDADAWHLAPVFPERALGWLTRATRVGDVFHAVTLTDDAPRGVAYVVGDGTEWRQEQAYAHPGGVGGGTGPHGIALHDGRVFALVIGEQASPVSSDAILAERATGGTWTNELVHAQVMAPPGMSALAVDSDGEPHVCVDGWDGVELVHAERIAGEWRTETISTAVDDHFCALATDAGDRLHLVRGSASGIHHAVREGGTWSPEVVVDDGSEALSPIDLRLDALGRPHLAYVVRGDSGQAELRYAWLGPAM